jgi:hypothetical protein
MPTKNIDDLIPEASDAFIKAQADPDLLNKPFRVICVLRSFLEQEALYAQGRELLTQVNERRKKAGLPNITEEENRHSVTWTMKGAHLPDANNKSRAVDIVALDKNGRITWEDIYYNAIGPIFEHYGFKWGVWLHDKTGRLYHSDKGHMEWPK